MSKEKTEAEPLMMHVLGVSIMLPSDPEKVKGWIEYVLDLGGVPTFTRMK